MVLDPIRRASLTSALYIASTRGVGLTHNLAMLALNLHRNGQDLVVVSDNLEEEGGIIGRLVREGISYHTVNNVDSRNPQQMVLAAQTLAKIMERYEIEVVHANGVIQLMTAFMAGRLLPRNHRPALVVSIHSTAHGKYYEALAHLAMGLTLSTLSDFVLPVSESTRQALIRWSLPPEMTITVHNSIDTREFDEVTEKGECENRSCVELGESEGSIIGCFARLHPRKGHKYLIHASSRIAKDFPEVKFVITGEGPYGGSLRALCKRLGVSKNFLFTGKVSYRCLYHIAASMDILLLPSLAELFPFAILEAMAAAKPVVATNVGGIPECVRHCENGYLVPPRDSGAIAEAALRLLHNPDSAQGMGARGRAILDSEFSMKGTATKIGEVYQLAGMCSKSQ